MSFEGVLNEIEHPLRRAHSINSFFQEVRLTAEQALSGALQDITLRTRRLLSNQDWSGERLPRPIAQRMAQNLNSIGVNLQRHYSFGSSDSLIFEYNMVSPAEMRQRVEEEMRRTRTDYERQQRDGEVDDNLGAVGGQPTARNSPSQQADRYERLRQEYDALVHRHNQMLREFIQTIDSAEALETHHDEDLAAVRMAQAAAENEAAQVRASLAAAQDARITAEVRARAAQNALGEAEAAARQAEAARQEAEAARQEAEATFARSRTRDRRRTNFGEGDYNIDVTLKIIKEFDGSDPAKLEGFLRNCKLVFSRVPERDHPEVLQLILTNKLVDRAMRDTRYRDINSMEELEKELQSLYGTKKSIASLHGEMSSLRHKDGESISNYGARAETIAAELVEQLAKNIPTRAEQRAVGEGINKCAQAAFEAGLHGQLQTLVRAKGFKTLHEAVDGAIDIAKTINADLRTGKKLYSKPKGSGECYKCGATGHFANKCPEQQPSGEAKQTNLPIPGVKPAKRIGAITLDDEPGYKLPSGAYQIFD